MLLQNLDIKQGLCNGPHHQTQNPPAFLAVLWPGGIRLQLVIPKVRYSEGSVNPKVRYSEGSLIRK